MSGSKKQRDDLARAKAKREAEAAQEASRRRNIIIGLVAAGVLIVGGGTIALAATRGGESAAPEPANTSAASAPAPTAAPTASATPVSCREPGRLQTKPQTFPDGPETKQIAFTEGATYGGNFETNCGKIAIDFDTAKAPELSKNMIFLLNTGAPKCVPLGATCNQDDPKSTGRVQQVQGFYDNTLCHRLTTSGIFVLQCGDPTGTGTGGPGYRLPDENLPKAGTDNYPAGTVAMANSGPDTNGSQFFIVYKDTTLPPDYSIIGRVTEGLDIVEKVAAAGVDGGGSDGKPAQPLELVKALSFERRLVDS